MWYSDDCYLTEFAVWRGRWGSRQDLVRVWVKVSQAPRVSQRTGPDNGFFYGRHHECRNVEVSAKDCKVSGLVEFEVMADACVWPASA